MDIEADDVPLYTDPILMERVLRNLLSNAVQYTEEGTIRLWCENDEDDINIYLEDTGIGIPAHAVEEVFSEYFQLNNPERDRGKGLGLGLAIVKRLAKLMNMPLLMESKEGIGTCFCMTVPRGVIQVAGPADEASKAQSQALPVGHRVLVVDDELQVLKSMKHTLEDCRT